ncbi:F-box/LRR-repeat protein 2-like [Aphidius gifuensis]|uniref:F-box/LRR-repeat protein 2-like n=1 Tax=Aphidius gifuensis TaxID=684658 RepID=UPI001CDD48D0|nr:F-box/LRR-repeat protein 2-like [Aphidius gifuensis]XP_044001944.1 F-box/LRR-repeat protein 2-like [Aphidius gifuensis]
MMSAKRICIDKDQQTSTDDVYEKMDLINSLDNDSLAQIFILLPVSERITMDDVCSKWKEACQLAWHDIKKYKCSDAIVRGYEKCILTQSYVEKILFKCRIYLKELILSRICDSSIMPVIAEYCKNLTTLEFEIVVQKEGNADRFGEAFTQLKQLKVVKIYINKSCEFQFQILNSLPKDINEIHLFFGLNNSPGGSGINLEELSVLTYSCKNDPETPSLFSLREFTNLQSLTIRSHEISHIIQEISKKTSLVYLDLERCTTKDEIFTFDQLSNLEHLNLKDAFFWDRRLDIPSNLLGDILNTCKNLKHLDPPDLDADLAEIKINNCVNLRNLVYLNIRWRASDALIENIIKYCNNLKFINIDNLTSESIIKLTKLENLNYLKFGYSNDINDEVMVAVSNNCKKLKHLVLHVYNKVEASLFDGLSKLQYIESLNLALCWEIEDSAIIAIAENCKLLKSLNLRECHLITSTALIALTNLKNLKELNVGSNDNVEDNFIVKLRGIKSLNCSGCNKLTDAGVIPFIKNNPDLESLDISNTNVTTDTIVAADEVSKNRTNDTFLSIRTINPDLEKALVKSQWLTHG